VSTGQEKQMSAPLRAALLMLASTMAFGLMAVTIRLATAHVPTQEVAFFRNAFGLLALLPMLMRPGRSPLRTQQLPRYFLRSAIGLGSMLCGFWAVGHLPLSQAVSLSYSTPLFVTIAAVLWLGEKVRIRRWAAVIVGFIGVLVIVRPGHHGFEPGTLIAVLAALLSALVAIQIKQLTRVDGADTVVFYTMCSGCRCHWCRPCSCGPGRPASPGCGWWPPASSVPPDNCCGPARCAWARSPH
jgi:Permeases of the drug/metabolite transporter (DMT) superfamily